MHHVVVALEGLTSGRVKTPMEWMRNNGKYPKTGPPAIRSNDRISSKVVLDNSLFSKYQIYFNKFRPYPSN
jgi:hypothetical protein